jgi:hypothetical protein
MKRKSSTKAETMQTAQEALESIQSAATSADPEVRIARRRELGSVLHQGDVYLHRVPDNHPRGALLGTMQIAVGTTIGSRHVVEGSKVSVYAGVRYPDGFTEPAGCAPNALLGPVIVAEEDYTLTHPEHAHHRSPAGVDQVTYQFDARTMLAVAD